MKKKIIIISSLLIIVLTAILYSNFNSNKNEDQIEVKVKKGMFDVVVTTAGELQAENSEDILGPSRLRNIGVYQVKITDLIPEGTIIDSGDYVATLDRTEVTSKLKDIENEVQKYESQFLKTKLDTTLELRTARDEQINLKYAMEETKIALDQSKYEAPAVIRQATINLEKAQRAYEQALKNYKLKVQQSNAKMVEVSVGLDNQQRKKADILAILDEFEIKAPMPGMLIYTKEWNGTKKKVGSTISAWEPTVATLPDLSTMLSKTFVNEIDIRKLKIKQKVKIGVDAFPEKKYTGVIFEIANIGEQMQNSDAKVFEVLIKVDQSDSILRPSMTTSNSILTATYQNVLYIPLDAVFSDSIPYVIKTDGFKKVKQVIELGESNENEVIVVKGLMENDIISLTKPKDADKLKFVGMEIYEEMKKKEAIKKKKQEELNKKKSKNSKKKTRVGEGGSGGDVIIFG